MESRVPRTHFIDVRKMDEWNVYKLEKVFHLSNQLIGVLPSPLRTLVWGLLHQASARFVARPFMSYRPWSTSRSVILTRASITLILDKYLLPHYHLAYQQPGLFTCPYASTWHICPEPNSRNTESNLYEIEKSNFSHLKTRDGTCVQVFKIHIIFFRQETGHFVK